MSFSLSHEQEVPPLAIRWLRPQYSSAHLDLPTAPIAATQLDAWRAFTMEESNACENAWQKLSEDERISSGAIDRAGAASPGLKEADVPGEGDEDDDKVGVAIYKDKLYEVDVKAMQLKPVYWKLTGPPIPVMRATWMYDETHPVEAALAEQLETSYRAVKPWLPVYAEELAKALEVGTEGHEKLKHPLSDADGACVVFQDGSSARIISDNLASRVQQSLYTSFLTTSHAIAFPGAQAVYRGFDAAERAAHPPPEKGKEQEQEKEKLADPKTEKELVHTDNVNKTGDGDDGDGDITDLILIVHGIGQGLAVQYETLNFVYATNLFRQVIRKQSGSPALGSIMRSHRVQVLPVQWRTTFGLSIDEERERQNVGLDNRFTLEDITLKDSIPFVRELSNNVILDVPYFMSAHRDNMIQSVCTQANRLYRLWCTRNPGFDKNGRVHIIAHSLGSALVTHVLSDQPTIRLPLSEMSEEERNIKQGFLFNTSSIFMAGSPLAVFMLLDQSQLIARKGRERTKRSPGDEALDRRGVFGCLAVDAIYNVFYPSDPIAYRLNPCVDAKLAEDLPPFAINTINASFFSTFSSRLSKLFNGVSLPSMPALSSIPNPWSRAASRPSSALDNHSPTRGDDLSDVELGGHVSRTPEKLVGSRAERRFAALNPHGTLDFYLPSEGALSEYIDMVTAHLGYWSDATFAAFVLAEIFAKKEDRMRTGLVPAAVKGHRRMSSSDARSRSRSRVRSPPPGAKSRRPV